MDSADYYAGTSLPKAAVRGDESFRTTMAQRLFLIAWHACNVMLVISIVASLICIGWEYSTRRYLRGFSDAIIPGQADPEHKVEAILSWMENGPARLPAGPDPYSPQRDPTATLNYKALLSVCGTATNAFINLADSSGLTARRLLLLDQNRQAKHVVAEVLINGRWIVVDPTFRSIPRGTDGGLLTAKQLSDPDVLAAAVKNFPRYHASYTYENTAHVRISRLPWVGRALRGILNIAIPGWEDSETMSLLVERESFASAVVAVLGFFFFLILRTFLRWAGESWYGVRPARLRDQIRRAAHAFLGSTG